MGNREMRRMRAQHATSVLQKNEQLTDLVISVGNWQVEGAKDREYVFLDILLGEVARLIKDYLLKQYPDLSERQKGGLTDFIYHHCAGVIRSDLDENALNEHCDLLDRMQKEVEDALGVSGGDGDGA